MKRRRVFGAAALLALAAAHPVLAHGISTPDAAFVASAKGAHILPFLYLGAKHMVTGYDHLLFILGVIFFLRGFKQVALYVSLFSLGHSITLLSGVLLHVQVNAYLIDALIGLSVVYKAFDNLGGFKTVFGWQPDTRAAVSLFGLAHGFGLATKLQALKLNQEGLIANLVAFNVGVEAGQLLALSAILAFMVWWRAQPGFARQSAVANAFILCAGFILIEYQLTGFFTQRVP